MLLLPELGVRLEVHLAIIVLLEQMTVRRVLGRHGRLREENVIVQALAVDPLLLRERRMTTGRVPWSRLTLTGMTLSGQELSWHGRGVGVPSARCKTPLASIYGLMSEISPAFTLPASSLVRSLLDDTNLALAKFLEDQTVHGFLPVPGRRQ